MPLYSPHKNLDILEVNILDYLFPKDYKPSDEPLWIDAYDPSINLSPRQAILWIRRVGYGLENAGVRRFQDVCMIFTPNHIFVPVAYLGIAGYGAAFCGANPAYTASELAQQIKATEPRLIFVHPSLCKTALEAASRVGFCIDRLFLFSDDEAPSIGGLQDWRELIGTERQGESWRWQSLTARESATTVATVNFSSGTTGLPKGVSVSHYNLIANVEQTIFSRSCGRERIPERWLGVLPLYHAFGQLFVVLIGLRVEIPTYIMKVFSFEPFLQHIQKYRITTLQTAPPILVMLDKRPETAMYDLSSMKEILSGAAPLSRELQNNVAAKLKANIQQAYGMTELVCVGLMFPGPIQDNTGSVGVLLPNMEAKLIDDEGNESEERGELFVRGPNVCMGYWRNEAATNELICDEAWLRTGDVAVVNEHGYFWIVDRKKELIKVNGFQVAPAELEAVLLENHNITDAAVTGIVLDDNEVPRAYIVLKREAKGKTSEMHIQDWVMARVAKHKYLTGGVRFVDEVPRIASGKIERKTLREWANRDADSIINGSAEKSKL